MTSRRRLYAAVLSGALAVAGLAACRSSPAVAAYVGATTITEHDVDAVLRNVTDAAAKLDRGAPPESAPQVTVPKREQVVATLVMNELCDRLGTEQNLTFLGVDRAAVARDEGLPADSTFAGERADMYSCIATLEEAAAPIAPSDAELRDVFQRGQAAGAIDPSLTFEDVGQQLDGQQVRGALGIRKPLAEAVAKYDVTVNPRYRPLEIPILSFGTGAPAIAVMLSPGERAPAVVNRT